MRVWVWKRKRKYNCPEGKRMAVVQLEGSQRPVQRNAVRVLMAEAIESRWLVPGIRRHVLSSSPHHFFVRNRIDLDIAASPWLCSAVTQMMYLETGWITGYLVIETWYLHGDQSVWIVSMSRLGTCSSKRTAELALVRTGLRTTPDHCSFLELSRR